jgi:hypothetical protein
MSMTHALAGGIFIGAAVIWAGAGVRALIATRGATAAGRRDRTQKWQWVALGGLQVAIGVWFVTGPSKHPAGMWWLIAGQAAFAVWMFLTDVRPWLRSRLRGNSGHAAP